jgi:redox-sensitive bicupin YhaK (pirin superfamily)
MAGEILHRDSLGSEQMIRPGQLNLMTAGGGVAHAEESPAHFSGELHAVQLWVAQPERTRHGAPAFEHHEQLPEATFGSARATVIVGAVGDVASPARTDTEHVGVDLEFRPGRALIPLRRDFEYAIVVTEGAVSVGTDVLTPGHLGYLGRDRSELLLQADTPARLLLLGGVPFEAPVVMWWNFVGRTREEISSAARSWELDDGRFPGVATELERIPAPPLPW